MEGSVEVGELPGAARRALAYVLRHEGAHFREVQREARLATGQADHHLRRLEQAGLVTRTPLGHEVHFFPPTRPLGDRRPMAALRHPARVATARALFLGPRSLRGLSGAVGAPESTLVHHLRILVRAGVVYREQAGRRVRWGLSDPEQARRLLGQGPNGG